MPINASPPNRRTRVTCVTYWTNGLAFPLDLKTFLASVTLQSPSTLKANPFHLSFNYASFMPWRPLESLVVCPPRLAADPSFLPWIPLIHISELRDEQGSSCLR